MNTSMRHFVLIRSIPLLLGIALATGLTWPRVVVSEPASKRRPRDLSKMGQGQC